MDDLKKLREEETKAIEEGLGKSMPMKVVKVNDSHFVSIKDFSLWLADSIERAEKSHQKDEHAFDSLKDLHVKDLIKLNLSGIIETLIGLAPAEFPTKIADPESKYEH